MMPARRTSNIRNPLRKRAFIFILFLFGITLVLSGCWSPPFAGNDQMPVLSEAYRPPTLAATLKVTADESQTPTLLSTRSFSTTRLAPAASCTNNLSFKSDLTIKDGSTVSPGTTLDKRWKALNSGTCNWDENYSLRLINGSHLGINDRQPLYPAIAGSEFTLRLVFTAPSEPGSYQSAWQAFDPQGNAFGDPVFIDFDVK